MTHGNYARVQIVDIQWNTPGHLLIIGGTKVILTKTEYRLFYPLRHGWPLTYTDLARLVYNCEADEKVRSMMDKHIDRIRTKLRGTGIYVYCVLGYGYLLLQESVLPSHERK